MIYILILLIIILVASPTLLNQGASMSTIENVFDQWWDLADNWATTRGNLSKEEILAIIVIESSGNQTANNPDDPSWGLMGVTLSIGQQYASVIDSSELLDSATNIEAGSGYLSYLKGRYSASYPLDGSNGWIQIYNLGETKFLKGERVSNYEKAFTENYNNLVNYAQSRGL